MEFSLQMESIHENPRLQEALLQAKHGHRVHPCHYPMEGGGCSCGKCDSSQHGKHPALTGWQNAASTTEATIRRWWTDQPECNIGLAQRRIELLPLLQRFTHAAVELMSLRDRETLWPGPQEQSGSE